MEPQELLRLIKRLNPKIDWNAAKDRDSGKEYDLSVIAIDGELFTLEDVIKVGKMTSVTDDLSEYSVVVYFLDHKSYIKVDGFYTSYEGSEFDGSPYLVQPKEKIVTFYEQIKIIKHGKK